MKKPGVRIAELSYTIGIEMNERLRELEKQCWNHYIDGVLIDGHLHFDVQKFAKLVIQECALVAALMETMGRKDIGSAILDRFEIPLK